MKSNKKHRIFGARGARVARGGFLKTENCNFANMKSARAFCQKTRVVHAIGCVGLNYCNIIYYILSFARCTGNAPNFTHTRKRGGVPYTRIKSWDTRNPCTLILGVVL